jgi:hypothetical protein
LFIHHPVFLESNFDSSGSVHDSQPALLKLEHIECKNESSTGSRDFPNPKISEINKDDTSQYPPDARHDDPIGDSSPGKGLYISAFTSR